jgi:hypothetical protein
MKQWIMCVSVCLGLSMAGCAAEPLGEEEIDEANVAQQSAAASCSPTVLFADDFSNKAAGWTRDTGWQIGPATTSTCQSNGAPDPSFDHTPTADNGVAGAYIGGCPPTSANTFPYYYLTSPPINADVDGSLDLSLWRWLNTSGRNHVKIDVFDGSNWITIYQTALGVLGNNLDSSWTNVSYDLRPYRNPNLRIRFGWRTVVFFGGSVTSGWNIDDLQITTDACL